MFPLLRHQDTIFVRQLKKSRLKVNDIITIKQGVFFITHRIIYISKAGLILTKGDHNFFPDKPVKRRDVIGKVEAIARKNQTIYIESFYLFQSSIYFEEIKIINKLLTDSQINYVFLKGLPLHLYYGKQIPRRIFADCDILIDSSEESDVEKILSSLGYKKKEHIPHKITNLFLRKKTECDYWKRIGPFKIVIDIHTQPTLFFVQSNNLTPLYPYKLVMEFSRILLIQKKEVSIYRQRFPLLKTEYQIVYLALHLFHDNFSGYHKYLFLEKVINSSNFDEDLIIKIIKDYELENFLYCTFSLLRKYYNPNFSKNFLQKIKSRKSKQMTNIIKTTSIFSESQHTETGVERFKNIYYLSKTHSLIKPLIFFRLEIIVLIMHVLIKKIRLIIKINNRSNSLLPKNTYPSYKPKYTAYRR